MFALQVQGSPPRDVPNIGFSGVGVLCFHALPELWRTGSCKLWTSSRRSAKATPSTNAQPEANASHVCRAATVASRTLPAPATTAFQSGLATTYTDVRPTNPNGISSSRHAWFSRRCLPHGTAQPETTTAEASGTTSTVPSPSAFRGVEICIYVFEFQVCVSIGSNSGRSSVKSCSGTFEWDLSNQGSSSSCEKANCCEIPGQSFRW